MDPKGMKLAVASTIRRLVQMGGTMALADALSIPASDIEVHPVTDLQFHIRVKTSDGAPRYYLVKVSEAI